MVKSEIPFGKMQGEQAKFQFQISGDFDSDAETIEWLNTCSGLNLDYNNVVFTTINPDKPIIRMIHGLYYVEASFDICYDDKNEQIMFDIMYLIEDIGLDCNNYANGKPVYMKLLPNSVHIIREPNCPP